MGLPAEGNLLTETCCYGSGEKLFLWDEDTAAFRISWYYSLSIYNLDCISDI